jgi:hypothetical protein
MDACSNEKTPGLVFITQTGSGKPRDVQTQIRKHVMKDIGKSRRKQGRRGKFPTWEISIDSPESMDSGDSRSLAPGTTEADSNGEYSLDADVLALTFDRLWTGRMDPFVRYPIEMNQRTLRLIDHGNHLLICFTLYALTLSRSL